MLCVSVIGMVYRYRLCQWVMVISYDSVLWGMGYVYTLWIWCLEVTNVYALCLRI